jgi:hypothetical protein
MPSVRARRRIPSTISSSVTDPIDPPLRRTASRAYVPSAGFPMARLLAMVEGRCGLNVSHPWAKAVATGEQPSACAPETRTGCSAMSPTSASWRKPLSILHSWLPLATGTTTWSGACQPSCSATSKARVFDPSA